ncbi:MAG: 30S ribosomal protein S17 [Planctomycetes bacterium RIFCSPHIGHO2_12_FULL_52_36]|nr:MAG: 30S ribosomal protein S17 [Planctomycetes bacterium RIFCSPHIGHO2_02_FULL_52_58]OHB93365.1 MAG: 30S ribosomal protein S17 [Planctomycetes bacterium RIFCSPHIGHO2_12_FULL_52_36]
MEKRSQRKRIVGVVSSDKMDKTISVKVEKLVRHPVYGKYVKRVTVYKAHDEEKKARVGDKVEITETRPISKTKRWRLVRILGEAA